MNEYETVYIVKPDAAPARFEKIAEKLAAALEKNEGKVLNQKDWGNRRLAYFINKTSQGHYMYTNYCGKGSVVAEVERVLKLDEDVIRYLTVSLSKDFDPASQGKGQVVNVPEEARLIPED
ncbi:30S ribosomal protein S6 [bacterium]|nr:30S ribosomal protein S6 [bacterium]